MKRRLVKLVVLLLLGAIVNVAVAWGCAIWSTRYTQYEESASEWRIPPPLNWPRPNFRVWGDRGFGFKDANAFIDAPADADHDVIRGGSLAVFMCGWPCLSLYAERHRLEVWTGLYGPLEFEHPKTFTQGIAIPPWLSDWHWFRCLPTQPLVPGFTTNTLFYAAILWGLFAAPFALRRRRRIKRGLCPKCAYPIGTSDVCTECGEPRAKHKAQTQKAQMPSVQRVSRLVP